MNLESLLKERNIPFEKHTHRVTYTSQGLAQVEHVSGYNVAKPVIVKGKNGLAMCVLAAPSQLDLAEVSGLLNDPDLRLATETEMAAIFAGCQLGAEPPVGSLFDMKTIMDERLRADEYLVMQAGTHTDAVKLRREDWERLCQPIVAPIARR